ncbi:tetratricopeptide repeat protein [Sphingobacterium alkalisoli]|uniref:Tetratricopeptide repeat protein n=1 Tax=Sphingobacterium alkalisoli TaxID=1874115 RepID=A0A4U0GN16_9SPHI|nr:tetratricopeptide repeat protein [Sphingobacterium alkalisoli]
MMKLPSFLCTIFFTNSVLYMVMFLSIFLVLVTPSVCHGLPSTVDTNLSYLEATKYAVHKSSYFDREIFKKNVSDTPNNRITKTDKISEHVHKAITLYGSGHRQSALQIINEIESTVLARKEYHHLSNLLRIKSVILYQAGFRDEGLQLIERSLYYAKKIADRDSHHIQLGYAFLAKTGMVTDETIKLQLKAAAYQHMTSVSTLHPKQQSAMTSAITAYATSLMDKKELDSAEFHLLKALRLFSSDTLYKVPDTFYTLEILGILCYESNRFAEAINYYQKALRHNESVKNAHHTSRLYLRMHGAYDKMNKDIEADYYLRQYSIIKANLDSAKDALINDVATKAQDQNSTSEQGNSRGLESILIVALPISISLFMLVWYIGRPFAKRKQYEESETENESFTEVSRVSEEQLSPNAIQLSELYNLAKANNPLFLTKFCSYYPRYIDRLNQLAFPELVSSELEICAYLKLNLDTKEISRYTYRSIRSIENRRYRVRKKLNLSPDTDLKNFLLNLDS